MRESQRRERERRKTWRDLAPKVYRILEGRVVGCSEKCVEIQREAQSFADMPPKMLVPRSLVDNGTRTNLGDENLRVEEWFLRKNKWLV